MPTQTQFIFLDDNINTLIQKGEVIDDYYNHGKLFDQVVFITINSDKIPYNELQRISGTENVLQYNISIPKVIFFLSLGYRPILLEVLLKIKLKEIKGLRDTRVTLVRSYGSRLGAYLGSILSKETKVPHLISLHENYDTDYLFSINRNIIRYLYIKFFGSISKYSLKNATHVIIVYKSIENYLIRLGVKNYSLIYNLIPKPIDLDSTKLHQETNIVKLIWIGRLIPEKTPINIIKAIENNSSFTLKIIGKGPIKRDLINYVVQNHLESRITFIDSISNHNVIYTIKNHDIFVANIKVLGIPKTVIEAMYANIPIVINKPKFGEVYEYKNSIIKLVDDSPEGYRSAFLEYIANRESFHAMANFAYQHAVDNFDFDLQLNRYISLVERLIA